MCVFAMHRVFKIDVLSFKVQADGADEGCVTFVMHDEDHTLGNSLRYMVMKKSVVVFCLFALPPHSMLIKTKQTCS